MWFIRILLLIIIFLGGVYIGNVYMPQRDATTAVAVAVPPLETYGTDMSAYNFDAAQKTLADMYADMMQDPEHFSPTVSDARLKILNMTLALQNYNITRSKYEAEIAKNRVNAQPSPDYVKAAADYAAAKKTFEKYMQDQKAKEAALIP
ncbi:MAG: hypothetical protein LBI01_02370, partial [Elusimicrobium sp.]|nr:hypothetical protein [Elusimicrobium sp.]